MASPELDVSSGIPLYRQIMEILREEISQGQASPDEPMTEDKLLTRFQVSRAPIRQALNELASTGFVYRKQGRGTFPVTGARIERPANLKSGNLYQYLVERGLKPASQVSGIERITAPPAVARRLGVEADEAVLHFTRMLALDGEPFAANDIYIRSPHDFLPSEDELNEGGSAFALIERDYGIALDRAEHEAWATAASAEQAAMLGLEAGSPLLVIDTLFYTVGGLAAGWRSALHKPDDFKFRFIADA